jgi:hypothetical protein
MEKAYCPFPLPLWERVSGEAGRVRGYLGKYRSIVSKTLPKSPEA